MAVVPALANPPVAVAARVDEVLFAKFLTYRRFTVELRDGTTRTVCGLSGPGHNVSAVAAIALDERNCPAFLFKTGDTRASRVLRGEPYVLLGYVAGRLDKPGEGPEKIGLMELAEEVGGEVVADSYRPLGKMMAATMPYESTESDSYHMALVKVTKAPTGDGGGMELTGLIGPLFLDAEAAFEAMNDGRVAEGSRAQVVYSRACDAMGYLPQLGVYVQDHGLRFDTLGLGEPRDPRGQGLRSDLPEPPAVTESAQVDNVVFDERHDVPVGDGAVMIEAMTRHAIGGRGIGKSFRNQLLQLDYDRAKTVSYYREASGRPMVQLLPVEHPLMAAKALATERINTNEVTDLVVWDVTDEKIPRGARRERELGAPSSASSGQTDLYYRFFAREVAASQGFVPLAEAIRACREGQADAQTEALLFRLAQDLQWVPGLDMSVEEARACCK